MAFYEHAEAVRPAHNDDSVLRWNACARMLMRLPEIEPDLSAPEPIQLGIARRVCEYRVRRVW